MSTQPIVKVIPTTCSDYSSHFTFACWCVCLDLWKRYWICLIYFMNFLYFHCFVDMYNKISHIIHCLISVSIKLTCMCKECLIYLPKTTNVTPLLAIVDSANIWYAGPDVMDTFKDLSKWLKGKKVNLCLILYEKWGFY